MSDYRADDPDPRVPPPVPVVAIAAWLVPGLGYLLVGERRRAIYVGVAIVLLFVFGILIAGVRCVDVPGFDGVGNLKYERGGQPTIQAATFRAVAEKPWYVPQLLTGPITIGASVWSVSISDTYARGTARLWDIGTLYTAVAGMLNLLAIIDAAHRAAVIREANPQLGPM